MISIILFKLIDPSQWHGSLMLSYTVLMDSIPTWSFVVC